jgi:hypothetical protein
MTVSSLRSSPCGPRGSPPTYRALRFYTQPVEPTIFIEKYFNKAISCAVLKSDGVYRVRDSAPFEEAGITSSRDEHEVVGDMTLGGGAESLLSQSHRVLIQIHQGLQLQGRFSEEY